VRLASRQPLPWPAAGFDVRALRASGWAPTPLRQFVFKIHQRCNLACDYCYVYTLADQSWRSRPVVMSEEIYAAAASRIASHVTTHGLTEVVVVLHGGEPLLAGPIRLASIARTVRAAMPHGVTVKIGMQTNGVLLTERMLETLLENNIRVGVSLDGTAENNDAHRRSANGRGSYARVEAGLRLLSEGKYRDLYSGLLCTIDPATDPIATYEALLGFAPPAIDVLFPHANWATPGLGEGTRIADWLITLFDRWAGASHLETRVRLFESIIRLLVGGQSRSEFVGLTPSVVAVVETDGDIEQTDALKSAYEGAAATGLSVLTDDFDAMLTHPGTVARQIGTLALSPECQPCDLRDFCGGGHYAHRYKPGSGFQNRSVYCQDLYKLIHHVRGRMVDDLAALRFGGGATVT
jgi:uncharacterized protein